ncbi:interferon lambda receptor 1 [Thunnus thynnus]|uniref:interferon lambda receptor 1 n=1 Tax=Thunnus thynnus TaxID=8237 RepID=UPI00352836F8
MKMWSMNVIILLLFCDACHSTGNSTVTFISKNFYNVLHWEPAKPAFTGEKILYSVKYWSDTTEEFKIKPECQNITALFCDLTDETPSLYDVHYRARVYINGSLHGRTIRFTPLRDTVFGRANLSTYSKGASLHVNVTLPLGPKGVSIADIINGSKSGPIKTFIVYTLHITSPKWAAQVKENTSGQFVINLKNNQTTYCGYVVYRPSCEKGRPVSESATFCVTLPGDHRMLLPWPLMSAALLAAIVIIAVVFSCIYVKGGKEKSMPQSLVTTFDNMPEVLQSPDRNLILSKPVVSTQSDQIVYATIQAKLNVSSVGSGGYSPQDIPCQVWQGSTGSSVGTGVHGPVPNQQDTSTQSSEIYGSVAVHVPAEENEDLKQVNIKDRGNSELPLPSNIESWDKSGTSPKLTSRVTLPDLDACESNLAKPLLLHTVRDPNGQLMLPSLTSQLQSSTDGTVSPFNPERKPLLSDLILQDYEKEGLSTTSLQRLDSSEWSDSGCDDSSVNTPTQLYCNTHYFQTQPVVLDCHKGLQSTPSSDGIFESGYKQNWMPVIDPGSISKDRCEYRRKNDHCFGPKKEEGGEEDEDAVCEEGSRQILLGDWVVQIQE